MCMCPPDRKIPVRYETKKKTVEEHLSCINCDLMKRWPNWNKGLKFR